MIEQARQLIESVGLTVAASRALSRPNQPVRKALKMIDPLIRATTRQRIPPSSLCYEGPPFALHYLINGWEYAVYLKRFGMVPDSAVLDIGCGVGRKAWAIIRLLSGEGSYRGFDIVPEAIDWCNGQWRAAKSQVSFSTIDVYNQYYHDTGARCAKDVQFPFADSSFDIVLSSSVYTHMLPADVATYLRESCRVARIGAHLVASFFVLDPTSRENIRLGRSVYSFPFECGGARVEHAECPEHVVAYEKEEVEDMFDRAGLRIVTCLPGRWSGRRDGYAYQDLYALTPAPQLSGPL